ncbi:MAG TPA: PPOX class F420-dependent oxidoreductase [Mycobacteriales bacterium]|jgi:PPOX class probable F420-dependent enzyme|nr:PPOX class F420-dependent oxidoreductase [Mycobacteriales bacterium]
MAEPLPSKLKEWLDGTSFPVVATVDPDGRPQLSVIWAKRDGDSVLFSTLRDRRKGRNLARDPSITLLITNPETPYEYVEIRGTAEMHDDAGGALIKELGLRYNGEDFIEPDEKSARRVVVRVTADHVVDYAD